jgi:hypothetical protein
MRPQEEKKSFARARIQFRNEIRNALLSLSPSKASVVSFRTPTGRLLKQSTPPHAYVQAICVDRETCSDTTLSPYTHTSPGEAAEGRQEALSVSSHRAGYTILFVLRRALADTLF